jgi:hypothetical protein
MVDPSVVLLTYFPGSPVPRVEIWTRVGLDCIGKPRYDYTTIGGPVCVTDEEWYALLGTAEHFTFERCKPNEP